MELNVTNENFAELKNSDLPLVVDHHRKSTDYIENAIMTFHEVYASSASELVTEICKELAEEYEGRVNVAKCDIEECEDIAAELGIRNIPTLLFIKGGQVVDKLVGAQSKTKLQEKIENLL